MQQWGSSFSPVPGLQGMLGVTARGSPRAASILRSLAMEIQRWRLRPQRQFSRIRPAMVRPLPTPAPVSIPDARIPRARLQVPGVSSLGLSLLWHRPCLTHACLALMVVRIQAQCQVFHLLSSGHPQLQMWAEHALHRSTTACMRHDA